MSKSNAKSTSKSSSASAAAAAVAAPEPIDEKSSPTLIALYDIDDFSAHHCGYCNQNGNISIGMSCEIMRIEDYQTLIDRGWRRSGTYIYKPTMDKTCCPLYTIKCDSANIELRKSQKNTLKTMRRYLEKNEQKKKKPAASSASTSNSSSQTSKQEKQQNQSKNLIKLTPVHKSAQKAADKTNAQKVMEYILNHDPTEIKSENKPEKLIGVDKLKSKQKRLFRKLIRLKEAKKIESLTDIEKYLKRLNRLKSNDEMSLEKYLKVEEGGKNANKLEIKLVRSWPPSKEFENTLNEEHKLYTKYQTVIHRDSPLECSMSQFKRFLCTSPLMKGSYSGPLASNLSQAALNSVDKSICGDIDAIGYGSFHQQYRVNGKLIGVGVVDILNDCVSSVYFFYDPEFQFLNMGTYSALREIAFTRQINKLDSNIKWYYLGFYAHSCRKMRYKGFFHPSYLLCPETYTWHSIEKCVELLDKSKYSRFASASEVDQDRASENIDDVKIRIKFKDNNMRVFPFKEFCTLLNSSFVPQFTHLVSGYCQLFGKKFSKNVLIKF